MLHQPFLWVLDDLTLSSSMMTQPQAQQNQALQQGHHSLELKFDREADNLAAFLASNKTAVIISIGHNSSQ